MKQKKMANQLHMNSIRLILNNANENINSGPVPDRLRFISGDPT